MVRRRHQQGGHLGQLRTVRLGAVNHQDQRADGRRWGSLHDPFRRWDNKESQGRGTPNGGRRHGNGSRHGQAHVNNIIQKSRELYAPLSSTHISLLI